MGKMRRTPPAIRPISSGFTIKFEIRAHGIISNRIDNTRISGTSITESLVRPLAFLMGYYAERPVGPRSKPGLAPRNMDIGGEEHPMEMIRQIRI